MKRSRRRSNLQFETFEPRHLLTSAPVSAGDVYSVAEDTPLRLASAEQTFIDVESVWRYLDDGSDQGTSWRAPAFNDIGWSQGQAELGYGDGDEQTEVSFGGDEGDKFATTYFRHSFTVTNPRQIAELMVEVRYDDGVAVYLNGTEIVRENLAPNAAYDQTASGVRSNESELAPFDVDPSLLVAGTNVISAEIHQVSPTSSDISFDLRLTGRAGGVGVLQNDTDADGDPLTARLVSSTANGSLRLEADGSFVYFPNLDFNGTDTFTYRANDGGLDGNVATVVLNVSARNDAPVAADDQYHALAGTRLSVSSDIGILSNDVDVDGDRLTRLLVSGVNQGQLSLNADGSFTYTPNGGFTGTDQFTYRVNDGTALSDLATVSILVTNTNQLPIAADDAYSTEEGHPLTITTSTARQPVEVFYTDFENGVPPAFDGVAVSSETDGYGDVASGANDFRDQFLLNASNPIATGDPARPTRLTLSGLPVHDSIDIGFLLAMLDGWDGNNTLFGLRSPDRFNVMVDGEIVFSETFDSVDRDQSYQPPVGGELDFNANLGFGDERDSAYDMSLESDLQRIPHTASSLTVEWFASGEGYRNLVQNVRDQESWAIDNVSVVLHLGDGGLATVATAIPLGAEWRYLDDGSDQGTQWRTPSYNDSSWKSGFAELGYGDGDEATVVEYGGDPDNKYVTTYFRTDFDVTNAAAVTDLDIRLKRDDGAVVYINGVEALAENIVSNPSYDTLASNGSGNERDYLDFSLDPSLLVSGQNVIAVEVHQDDLDSSDVSFDLELNVTEIVRPSSTKLGVTANDIDPEGAPLSAVLVSTTSHGELSLNADGTFTYVPTANFAGTDSFTYRSRDAFGAGGIATATITVTPGPNNRPIVPTKTYNAIEDRILTVNTAIGLLSGVFDSDGDALTARLQTEPTNGRVTVNDDGSFAYTPTPNFSGTDSFAFIVSDGTDDSATTVATVHVAGQPDAPAANTDTYFTPPNVSLAISATDGVLANDVDADGDALTAQLISSTSNGTLNLNPNGSLSYTPNNGFRGTDTFRYRASDGGLQSPITTVSITVDGPPVGRNDVGYTTVEDTPLTINAVAGVLANDTDPEGDSLTAQLVSQTVSGVVALNSNGSFSYTPNADFSGTDSFTYRAYDGDQASNVTTVTLTVSAVNDPPATVADAYEVLQNTSLNTSAMTGVLANDVDVDGPTLSVSLVPNSGPTHGQVTLNANGSFVYQPDTDFVGEDRFSYRVSDGLVTSSATPVTISVVDDSSIIVINEIMYHPPSENVADEYIELHNIGDTFVDLTGWQFDRGVDFIFPDVTLAGGQYLIIAADPAQFTATYGNVGARVIGGWEGQLSNRSEEIELEDENGRRVDRVTYSDEGDWAIRRQQGSGWEWVKPHDGGGSSLELINPNVSNRRGQNWTASPNGGTPGRQNAAFSTDTVPFISDLNHSPAVPRSNQAVTITAKFSDAEDSPLDATLFYRIAGSTPGSFSSTRMHDDGENGDAIAGDGEFTVVLPPRRDETVVEFYAMVEDVDGNRRTWPAPSDGAGSQNANALYQVDDDVYDGSQPIYRVIMTEVERDRLENLNRRSNDQMNATFVAVDGTGSSIRYNGGVRYRGNGSRSRPVPNYRVNLPSDDPWQGVDALNLNAQYPHSQVIGMTIFELAGLTAEEATAVQLRINGDNLAVQPAVQHGSYVRVEVTNSDFADNHFLNDPSGNVYRGLNGNLDYLGDNGDSYDGRYSKQTNASENDWSDLIALTRALSRAETPDSEFVAAVQAVADVDQWMRFLAVNALLVNEENGIINGRGDDYSIYCGAVDPRCTLLPHDMDTVFAIGDGSAETARPDRDLFEPREQPVFDRLLDVPEFLDLYYFHLQDLAQTVFAPANISRLLDRLLGEWVAPQTVAAAKQFASDRVDYVLQQIVGNPSAPPVAEIQGEPARTSSQTSANLTIGGEDVVNYRYRLDGGALSGIRSVGTPILLNGLGVGDHQVTVVAQNRAGLWQTDANATLSDTWTVVANSPNVVINEILAVNEGVVTHQGTHPDVIELQNQSTTTVNLSGMSISDDRDTPDKFVFPAGTSLSAGQRLVLYANDPDGTSGIHLGFGLSWTGETIRLYDAGGNEIDSVKYGAQLANRSVSRLSDGHWALTQPTIGGANGAALPLGNPSSLRINEWLTDGKRINENDFIELYNPQAQPVALGGLYLTDTIDGGRDRDKITRLSYIDGNAFRVFFADDDESAGADHLNFNLDSTHEPIGLYDSELDLIDMVISGPQTTDVSQGRQPDGSANYALFGLPTPGTSNVDNPGVADLLNHLRITEIMYHPSGSSDDEFIELQNTSSRTLDVTGVRIRGGVSFTFPSMVLDPGEVVVLVNNRTAFNAIYGADINVAGEFSGNLSNGGEEIELKVPLPLEIDILRFDYDDNPATGWPTKPDGGGASLVIIDTEGDYEDGTNWRPSVANGGTPGVISTSLEGDFDLDGDLDLDDLEALHAVARAGNNNVAYDVTDDGIVNASDVTKWVEELKGTLLGDANLDGSVDGSDFNRWNDHRFTFSTGWYDGDFNANGSVDTSDFNIWSGHRFQSAAPQAATRVTTARIPRAALADHPADVDANWSLLATPAANSPRDLSPEQRSPAFPPTALPQPAIDPPTIQVDARPRRRRLGIRRNPAESRDYDFAKAADEVFSTAAKDDLANSAWWLAE